MNELVALDLPGGDEFLALMLDTWDHGDAVLPIDQRLPPAAKRELLDSVRPSKLARRRGETTALDNGVPVCSGDAVVIATSGTTGKPKGVVLTHDALRASALMSADRLGSDSSDRWFGCLPVAHIGGFSVITKALFTNTPLTLKPFFDPADFESSNRECSIVSLVVAALLRIDPVPWRAILVGGSAMPEHLPNNAIRTYGMTETGSGCVYDGVPLDSVQIRAVDDELYVRGPMLARCYRSDTPDGTPLVNNDGWFRTGDAGSITDSGTLVVRGRIGDVVVTGGEKVWPDAVEKALLDMPGILECAVAGRPDDMWGQRVVVWVVAFDEANPPTLTAIRDRVKQTLPAYAAPKELVLVRELPRSILGKVQRSYLR
jgi:o-succinylbenzoate---CoA ligase